MPNEIQKDKSVYKIAGESRQRVYLRKKQRKALKRDRRHRKREHSSWQKVGEYRSPILSCLDQVGFGIGISQSNESIELIIPDVFCFSREPNGTVDFLRNLYGILKNYQVKIVTIDYSKCESLGLCAVLLMNLIMMECKKWRTSQGIPIEYKGKTISADILSEDAEINSLLYVSGILKRLGITKRRKKNDTIEYLGLISNGESSKVATSVIEYINRSLSRHGLQLTPKGNNYFGRLLGEIVDNCHQHGGDDSVWYTLGFYNYDGQSNTGNFRLVILDFGQTIYEGLRKNSTAAIRRRIEHYVRKSRIRFLTQESEETLYTLFSLQQRASRFASKSDSVRGNGTVVFLDAFQNLFGGDIINGKPLLSITSGRCSILFDGTYQLKEVQYGDRYRNKIIAFNKDNDLTREPDQRYVRSIKYGFPGTVISMEMHISDEHILRKD